MRTCLKIKFCLNSHRTCCFWIEDSETIEHIVVIWKLLLIHSSMAVYDTVASPLLNHWRIQLLALKLTIYSVASYPSIPHWLRWDIRHQAFLINEACGISGLATCWIRIIGFLWRGVFLKHCGKLNFRSTHPNTNVSSMFSTKFQANFLFGQLKIYSYGQVGEC